MTVTRVETILEQFQKVDLTAGGCPSVKVEIMNVNPTFSVKTCDFRVDHRIKVVFLGGVRALLEHRAHGGIAVDIGVVPLQIAVAG